MTTTKADKVRAKLQRKGWDDLALHDAIWCVRGLKLPMRAVLAKLLVHAGLHAGRRTSSPSVRTIASAVGVNKDTAGRVLRELERLGLVVAERVPGGTPVYVLDELPAVLAGLLVSESKGHPCPKPGDSQEGVSETEGVPSDEPDCPLSQGGVSPPTIPDTLCEGTLEGTLEGTVAPSGAHQTKPKRAARARKRPACERPPTWTPNDDHRAFARKEKLDVDDEAGRFQDHHDAKGNVFADWDAAFRTWLRKAVEFRSERANGQNEDAELAALYDEPPLVVDEHGRLLS